MIFVDVLMHDRTEKRLPSIPFLENVACASADGSLAGGALLADALEDLRRERYRTPDASLLATESVPIDLHHMDHLPNGRFHANVSGARFECMFCANDEHRDYLYVVLDTMRDDKTIAEGPLPRFPKWSWHPFLQGHLLSVEDPMYFESDLPVGWFYGTREQDYRSATAKLVTSVADHLGVPHEHIVFHAISSGGTAGLFTSAKIPGSVAVATNPQLDLTRFLSGPLARFEEHTGIDLAKEKETGDATRIDFSQTLLAGCASKQLIVVNCRSKMDYDDQLIPFCQTLGIAPHYGLQQVGNMALWVIDAHGLPQPHLAFESKTMYFAIDFLAKTLAAGESVEPYAPLYSLIGEFWHEKAGILSGDEACMADANPLGRVREEYA